MTRTMLLWSFVGWFIFWLVVAAMSFAVYHRGWLWQLQHTVERLIVNGF